MLPSGENFPMYSSGGSTFPFVDNNVNKELKMAGDSTGNFHFSSHKKNLSAGVSVLFYSDTIIVNLALTI